MGTITSQIYINILIMITNKRNLFIVNAFLFVLASVFCMSCSGDDGIINCIPREEVNARYNLSLPYYNTLNHPGGYHVFASDGTNGSKGIIVVNVGNSFKAYDRNAPHICPSSNTTLVVENGTKVICPSDSATWILTNGQPLNDATKGRPLIQYRTSKSGDDLMISN